MVVDQGAYLAIEFHPQHDPVQFYCCVEIVAAVGLQGAQHGFLELAFQGRRDWFRAILLWCADIDEVKVEGTVENCFTSLPAVLAKLVLVIPDLLENQVGKGQGGI